MAEASTKLGKIKAVLVLRGEFAGDAITLDQAYEELRGEYDQKSGVFMQTVGNLLKRGGSPSWASSSSAAVGTLVLPSKRNTARHSSA
jgi:hypothetical protein